MGTVAIRKASRQREVVRLVSMGWTNKQISDDLGWTVNTIRTDRIELGLPGDSALKIRQTRQQRHVEVRRLAAEGLSTKDIARKLNWAVGTIQKDRKFLGIPDKDARHRLRSRRFNFNCRTCTLDEAKQFLTGFLNSLPVLESDGAAQELLDHLQAILNEEW